jgi:hypothetical protein
MFISVYVCRTIVKRFTNSLQPDFKPKSNDLPNFVLEKLNVFVALFKGSDFF